MNILNFMQRFPDEASCIAYLKEQREQKYNLRQASILS